MKSNAFTNHCILDFYAWAFNLHPLPNPRRTIYPSSLWAVPLAILSHRILLRRFAIYRHLSSGRFSMPARRSVNRRKTSLPHDKRANEKPAVTPSQTKHPDSRAAKAPVTKRLKFSRHLLLCRTMRISRYAEAEGGEKFAGGL